MQSGLTAPSVCVVRQIHSVYIYHVSFLITVPVPCTRWDAGTIFLDAVHPTPDLRPGSTFFQQAAAVGLGHTAALRHVLARACMRLGLPFEIPPPFAESVDLTMFAKLPPPRVCRLHSPVHIL